MALTIEVIQKAMKLLELSGPIEDLKIETLAQHYRRLALLTHPDKFPDDAEAASRAMIELNNARDILQAFIEAKANGEALPSEQASTRYTAPKSGDVDGSLVQTVITLGSITLFMTVPSAIIVTAAAFAAVNVGVAFYGLANIRSQALFGRGYTFGDLLINDARDRLASYHFGDLVLNRVGQAITKDPEYKYRLGDVTRAGIGFFLSASRAAAPESASADPTLDDWQRIDPEDKLEPQTPQPGANSCP